MTKAALTKKATVKSPTKSVLKTKKKNTGQEPIEPIKNTAQPFIKIAPVLFVASLLFGLAAINGTHYHQTAETTQPNAGNSHTVLAASDITPTNDDATTTNDNSNVVSQAATPNSLITTQASPAVLAQQSPQPISSLPASTQPTDSSTTPLLTPTPPPDPIPTPPVQVPDPVPTTTSDNLLNVVGNLIHTTVQHVLTI